MRFFNTTGPINPDDHYHIPALARLDRDELLMLIAQKKYFVLHAPRQTGKTSALLALRDLLNAQGHYRCLYINVEAAQAAREDVAAAMQAIIGELVSRARTSLNDEFPASIRSSGYDKRPQGFPQSVILCGVRDVRDYRIHSSQEKAVITGGSPFSVFYNNSTLAL